MLCVCVSCIASSSSSRNSPTSGGSGGIGPGISKPLETPIENKEEESSQDISRLQTNLCQTFFFEFYIYFTQCVFYCLVFLCLSPVGVSCSSLVQWTTRGEHGWQGQEAPSTNGRIGGR